MEEFDEKFLNELVQEALSQKSSDQHPFGSSAGHLSLAETDLMENLFNRLSKRFTETHLIDIFQDLKKDILSRKVQLTLKDIHTITKNCNKCQIDSSAELPKWNVENPDIAIVVESPSLSPDAISLMVNAFKNVGLSSHQLCLTYVNRCPVKRKYESKEVINCSPYLHTELQILNPKLILCLGGLPASVMYGTDIKIKSVRGQINWLGYWPILSTYSPQYVLKSNEFDQETNSILDNFQNDILHAYNFINKKSTKKIVET
jgi:DNA polymerase